MKTQPVYEGNQLDVDHIIFKKVFWTFKLSTSNFVRANKNYFCK